MKKKLLCLLTLLATAYNVSFSKSLKTEMEGNIIAGNELSDSTALVELEQLKEELWIGIDFGGSTNVASETGWNNLYPELEGKLELINSEGTNTGFLAHIHDDFRSTNDGGTTTPDESLNFPIAATSDNLFCNDENNTAGITIENLDKNLSYTFEVFASRDGATDNREAKYTIYGQDSIVGSLNPSSNTSDIALFENVIPDADGKIVLKMEIGENHEKTAYYLYLGLIRIKYEIVTAIDNIDSQKEKIRVYPTSFSNEINIYNAPLNSSVSVYSIAGTKILEQQINSKTMLLNTAAYTSGVYIVKITDNQSVCYSYKIIKK